MIILSPAVSDALVFGPVPLHMHAQCLARPLFGLGQAYSSCQDLSQSRKQVRHTSDCDYPTMREHPEHHIC